MLRTGRETGIGKIAVLRANGIGDFIFALPALQALRSTYPEAEIVLLGLPWHKTFLSGRRSPVDRVVVVPHYEGVREEPGVAEEPGAQAQFFEQMRTEGFDLAVQIHGGGAFSNPFINSIGAELTIGLKERDAPRLDRYIPYVYWQPEILRFLEVVGLVGAFPPSLEPHLEVTREDLLEAYRVVPPHGGPLAVMHSGAGDTRRRWPPQRFAEVADRLSEEGMRIVLTGDSGEHDLTGAVRESMHHDALDVAGRLSLGGLAGLLSTADLVVANDSGPLHLAEAVGAWTVGIYWCGNLINAEPITRATRRAVLSWRLTCPACGTNCLTGSCEHGESFVADAAVHDVIEEALDLLSSKPVSLTA